MLKHATRHVIVISDEVDFRLNVIKAEWVLPSLHIMSFLRVFCEDVTAANLVFLNYEKSAMLVIPISPAGVELFLTATSFFLLRRKNKIAGYLSEEVLYVDFTSWIKF